jgi:inward rectifier potassium channel
MVPTPPRRAGRAPLSDAHPRVERLSASEGYLSDLYHFLLVSSWSRLLIMLALLYIGSNCLFAIAYFLAGDSIQGGRPGSFADAFFFSVQTMATIGYGNLLPRTLWANILVTLEALVGLLGLALLTGLIFAKFSRPTARVLFSRVAVIAPWDGVPSLIFRMANQRGNQMVEARVHVVLARNETTAEGEVFRRLHDLELIRDQTALFAFSWTAIHPIGDASPLHEATRASLAESEAEIIVSLTGLDESFSETVHARHSYRVDDIVWGARFVDVLSRLPDGRPHIDYTRFHDVIRTGAAGD